MCEKCLKRFETLPPDLVHFLDQTEHELLTLVDKLQPILDAYISVGDAFQEVAELSPEHPDYAEAQLQLAQIKRNTTLAYILGWHSAARARSSSLAMMYLQGTNEFTSTGAQDRLAYNHHHMQTKN
jgi:hypothetical protein